jgi:hypothetical protein
MGNQTVTFDKIVVHGRGSVVIDFKVKDAAGTQVDISGWDIYFEVDGLTAAIREPLVPDPDDALGQRIVLERDQVEMLKTTPTRFAVVDERLALEEVFIVLWDGTILRTGYIGIPDEAEG